MIFKSCNWITHGITFETTHMEMCCMRSHAGGGNLFVKNPYNGELLDWDKFFELKKKFIEENKQGKVNPKCKGCFYLHEDEWSEDENYINFIHFNHWTHCNCGCIYCFTDYDKENCNKNRYYNVLPVIKDMFEKNLLKTGGYINFAGGEPTILEEFDELLDFFVEKQVPEVIIHSSGIKYSDAIERGIKAGVVSVVVSVDSGSREVYRKIKNIDTYDKVIENLRKYASFQNPEKPLVTSKYIMMPKINDNIDEATKWLETCEKIGLKSVAVEFEYEWFNLQRKHKAFPKHAREVFDFIRKRADELGMNLIFYNSALHFVNNEKDFPKFDFYPFRYPSLKNC